MYIDAGNHGEEAKTFFAMDMHRMQFVVIENSIIYTLWTVRLLYIFLYVSVPRGIGGYKRKSHSGLV